MKNKGLSIVVPVYNEESVIKEIFGKLKKTLSEMNIDNEIIAVNDCSTDGSGDLLNDLEGVRVINHNPNRGYGASLKTGIKSSRFEYVLITDADGTYPIEAIPELYRYIDDYDMVVGSREKKGNAIPLERKYAKKFLNKFASYLAGNKIPDLNSGLRIFRKEIVFKYWKLFPERFSFTSTITMVCLSHGYSTKFHPIDYHKRSGKSSIKSTDFFNFLRLVTKLSLFFKPFKVFFPMAVVIFLAALSLPFLYFYGITERFLDTTFTVLCATALQTFFFGLLAEIIIHNK